MKIIIIEKKFFEKVLKESGKHPFDYEMYANKFSKLWFNNIPLLSLSLSIVRPILKLTMLSQLFE